MAATILIADDDAVQRRLLENMVQRCGYQTIVVESGERFLAQLENTGLEGQVAAEIAQPTDTRPVEVTLQVSRENSRSLVNCQRCPRIRAGHDR